MGMESQRAPTLAESERLAIRLVRSLFERLESASDGRSITKMVAGVQVRGEIMQDLLYDPPLDDKKKRPAHRAVLTLPRLKLFEKTT
jgi:hypothetical protein